MAAIRPRIFMMLPPSAGRAVPGGSAFYGLQDARSPSA